MTSEETLKSKIAFEKFALSHGVHIKHYHADNGRFKGNLFTKSIEDKGQTISFCGVGAHHQNGIVEKRIGDMQKRETALLLHAQRRWPDAINTQLWTYAIRAANDSRIIHQQMKVTLVQCQDFVQLAVYLQFRTNTILDVQLMF